MDYPDPDEEFELMHAEELEAMHELEHENFHVSTPVVKPKPKRQLDFSTPLDVANEPSTSVSRVHVQALPAEQVVVDVPETISIEDSSSTNNKRMVSSLFGDISDLEFELGLSSQSKRQKLEKSSIDSGERQDLLIKTIVEQRRMKRQLNDPTREEDLEKKVTGISTGLVPKWPFIPAFVRGERVYIRLYTEEKVLNDFKKVECRGKKTSFLETPYKELYGLAMAEIARKIDKYEQKKNVSSVSVGKDKNLWVEKYRPKIYLQLLSDEATNRALLYWLKLWDKMVFHKEPKVLNRGFPGQERRDLMDELHRPLQKVALLCGPPGLGKTTLAHMIAKQAGYCPVEVNASDDRSAQSFRTHIEAATQMKSVIGADPRPNCLILDEIDGAPQPAVDVLVKYVTHKHDGKKKKGNEILKRPIICICNDIYVPALRALRQIAFTLVFPPTSSVRLGERLMEISKTEKIITDLGTMMVLSEKSNNDIRSCLSVLQYLKAKNSKVTLSQIQSSSVGLKDMQQGLFNVWDSIFHIKLNKTSQVANDGPRERKPKLSGMLGDVLRRVQSFGDYDRLTLGVFENYAKIRSTDSSLVPVADALNWFITNDIISTHIHSTQTYSLYPYLPWTFIKWHLLFATIQRPKLNYPSSYYDAKSQLTRNRQILDFAYSGMAPTLQVYQDRNKLLLDVTPMLVELITPNVRPVSAQLFSQKERSELSRVVNVMVDYNVNYTQTRALEGNYTFQLDPNIEYLALFGDQAKDSVTNYTVRQLLSKEVECERIRRTAAKTATAEPEVQPKLNDSKPTSTARTGDKPRPSVPNHLQKLTPQALKTKSKVIQAKDFFGRVVQCSLSEVKNEAKTDEIVKSDIWFHFKEGYNNAVRKNVYISELL